MRSIHFLGASCGLMKRSFERLEVPRGRCAYSVAQQACEDIGGRLFDRLNGTYTQIELLCGALATYNMWFGIEEVSENHVLNTKHKTKMFSFFQRVKINQKKSMPQFLYIAHLPKVRQG